MSGKIVQLLKAIEAGIKAEFNGELKTVKIHGGRLTQKDLIRLASKAPAVYIGSLGGDDDYDDCCLDGDEQLIAIAVTKDSSTQQRHISIVDLAERLSALIRGNNWGLNFVECPTGKGQRRNISNFELSKTGVAMFSLSWKQQVRLD